MKRLALAFAMLVLIENLAWAACPPGTRYSCMQGAGGKVVCGCY